MRRRVLNLVHHQRALAYATGARRASASRTSVSLDLGLTPPLMPVETPDVEQAAAPRGVAQTSSTSFASLRRVGSAHELQLPSGVLLRLSDPPFSALAHCFAIH